MTDKRMRSLPLASSPNSATARIAIHFIIMNEILIPSSNILLDILVQIRGFVGSLDIQVTLCSRFALQLKDFLSNCSLITSDLIH